ncbi:hypothetical protein EYS14_16735 [Alteromonadaceae bacterium M269]|nr:hypothetical protein EYS14_16735 [Alteromonadaceae bacterium M269]
MTDNHLSTLQKEWVTLQNQYDNYEKFSLVIKLVNVVVTTWLIFALGVGYWALFVCAALWLQDGIWKTFQSRMATRIESVEKAIGQILSGESPEKLEVQGMQFNIQWAASRPGVVGLVAEYIKQSLKPTIAYPHVILMIIAADKLYF